MFLFDFQIYNERLKITKTSIFIDENALFGL
jgi:hypothetical protein